VPEAKTLNERDTKLVRWLGEAHAKEAEKLGGPAGQGLLAVPATVGEVAGKTVAAVKGQVGVARALVTEQAETHLRNAQDELREEHTEIAIYTRIEVFATEVGDRETAQLAREIRRGGPARRVRSDT
jgi:ferritin-like metal-binding protein YciE